MFQISPHTACVTRKWVYDTASGQAQVYWAWTDGLPTAIWIECRANSPHRHTHALRNRLWRI